MSNARLTYLFSQYIDQKLTLDERKEWSAMLLEPGNRESLTGLVEDYVELTEMRQDTPLVDSNQLWNKIIGEIGSLEPIPESLKSITAPSAVHRIHFLKTAHLVCRQAWFRYAAAILIILGIATWLWNKNRLSVGASSAEILVTADVAPGGNRATLTLADGSVITLDSAGYNGEPILKQGVRIMNNSAEGLVEYIPIQNDVGSVQMNFLQTPRGGQYQLHLPDGSKVWLNAASSIRFPSIFSGKVRQVEITGEVYFEVEKNRAKPFYVTANNSTIEVLGTHFDVNAYTNEGVTRTTLLEGGVKVSKATASQVLQPGQQAEVTDVIRLNKNVSTEQVMAWKNGYFNFNDADLKTVMRQLERWYDIEAIYPSQIPQYSFQGKLKRSLTLSAILRGLETIGVKYELEGRKLKIFSYKK